MMLMYLPYVRYHLDLVAQNAVQTLLLQACEDAILGQLGALLRDDVTGFLAACTSQASLLKYTCSFVDVGQFRG